MLMERFNDTEKSAAKKILDWSKKKGLRLWWGKGAKDGAFIPIFDNDGRDYFPIAVRTGYTVPNIQLQFAPLSKRKPFDREPARIDLLNRLNKIDGVQLPEESITKYPSFYLSLLDSDEKIEQLIDVFEWLIEKVKQS